MKPFVGYLYWFFCKNLEPTYIKNNLNLNLNFIYFLINFGADLCFVTHSFAFILFLFYNLLTISKGVVKSPQNGQH